MRQIKFRGEETYSGETVFGFYAEKFNDDGELVPVIVWDTENPAYYSEVKPESVAQFLGYDENGAEVYEGDILDSNEFAMESWAIFDILPDIGEDESRPNTFRHWVLKGTK